MDLVVRRPTARLVPDRSRTIGAVALQQAKHLAPGQSEYAAGGPDAQLAVIDLRQHLDPVQLALAHHHPSHAAPPRCRREEVTFLLCSWVTF
jgi:hypothetical protein